MQWKNRALTTELTGKSLSSPLFKHSSGCLFEYAIFFWPDSDTDSCPLLSTVSESACTQFFTCLLILVQSRGVVAIITM